MQKRSHFINWKQDNLINIYYVNETAIIHLLMSLPGINGFSAYEI